LTPPSPSNPFDNLGYPVNDYSDKPGLKPELKPVQPLEIDGSRFNHLEAEPLVSNPLDRGVPTAVRVRLSQAHLSPLQAAQYQSSGLPPSQAQSRQSSLPSVETANAEGLAPIDVVEFLPSLSRWITLGSWFFVSAVAMGAIATNFITYRTTVKTTAIVRPSGEARLVQVKTSGPITAIHVAENEQVEKGQVLAQIDDSRLRTQLTQLEGSISQGNRQLMQLRAQITALDQQVDAEVLKVKGLLDGSYAELAQSTRTYQDRQIVSSAEVDEALTELTLARQEVASYRQLVDSGAVSRLQLAEREASLARAQARLTRLQTGLNPTSAEVDAAEARIVQERSRGIALLAQLQQSREQILQQEVELKSQIERDRKELNQITAEIEATLIRAPASGTLYEVKLRNIGQMFNSGETIAQIIPDEAPLALKAVIPADQINKVEIGQPTQMRVSACPFSQFGTLAGTVTEISPDAVLAEPSDSTSTASITQNTGYVVIIEPSVQYLANGQNTCLLKPGNQGLLTIISKQETVKDFLWRKVRLQNDF